MLYITQNIIYNILCYIYHKKMLYTTERMLYITKTDQQFFNIVALNHHRLIKTFKLSKVFISRRDQNAPIFLIQKIGTR